jgi:hypothetical protein
MSAVDPQVLVFIHDVGWRSVAPVIRQFFAPYEGYPHFRGILMPIICLQITGNELPFD